MPGFDNQRFSSSTSANDTEDAFSDMRMIGTGGNSSSNRTDATLPVRPSNNGNMMVDSSGVERFPTARQQQYNTQQRDLNSPPPGQGNDQTVYPAQGGPPPQYSYQRGQGGDAGNTGNGQYRAPYGGDVGTTYHPGQTPQGDGQQPQGGQNQRTDRGTGGLPDGGNHGTGGLPDATDPVDRPGIFSSALAGGTGAYLFRHQIPKYTTKAADYALSRNLKLQNLIPEGGWLDKTTNPSFAGKTRTAFKDSAAQWWKDHFDKPAATTSGEATTSTATPGEVRVDPAAATVPGDTGGPAGAPVETPPPVDTTTGRPADATTSPPGDTTGRPAGAEEPPTAEGSPAPGGEAAAEAPRPPITGADDPVVPGSAPRPAGAAPTGAAAELTDTVTAAKPSLLGDMGKVGEFMAKPGVRTFAEGAGIGAGVIALDKFTPGNDNYGLGTIGVTAAFGGLPELMEWAPGWKTKLAIAGGAVVLGKGLNAVLDADNHKELQHFIAPNLVDTGLMTGALFLPTADPKLRLAAAGGAYVVGRMAKVNSVYAGIGAAGLGYTAFKLTHNAELGTAIGVGSWAASRVMHMFEPDQPKSVV